MKTPVRWNVSDNDPPLAGIGGTVLCDGEEVRHVQAFDTEEGRVDALCVGGHTGWEGQPHSDPDNPDDVCRVVLRGEVEVILPEEGAP